MASIPSFNRGGTIGVEYLGVIFSTILYGVTCIQTFHYFRSVKARSDIWWIKAMVLVLFVFDTAHEALIIHIPYHYLINHYGDPEALLRNVWSIPFSLIIHAIIAFVTNCFFVHRIWKLSSNKLVSFLCFAGAVADLVEILVYCILFYLKTDLLDALVNLEAMGVVSIASGVAVNTATSVAMIYYLHASRTGVRRSDSIITKLIFLVVGTGSATTVALCASLITYTVAPHLSYMMFSEPLTAKLYVNSVLTCLNLRDHIKNTLSDKSANSIHLSRIGHGPSVPTSERAQILDLSPSMQTNSVESGGKLQKFYKFSGSEA
ncbi:hypothetical protein FA95DRAFT_1609817 [Auriscalpium vulgare]|uniref:Uncharacterized protein n=1 Tax=Auriscalpium vulgare TaxID=40419 RepID=A0ACB8RFN5_9AGAM|nr:hypothetical protein FA95DRAFT_1609817 [Auriscalpium vulgare]